MKVLVACEFSGVVREAFKKRGHDAWSCDLLPAKDGSPHHFEQDVETALHMGWDLMVAHPPCTYLSRAGARWMYPTAGNVCQERLAKAMVARDFFMLLLDADIPMVAVENPLPLKIVDLPKESQTIQPYEYGDPFSKRTLLWLRGLPSLRPTNILTEYKPLIRSNTGGAKRGQKTHGGLSGGLESAVTFQGIADAMADQWGKLDGEGATKEAGGE